MKKIKVVSLFLIVFLSFFIFLGDVKAGASDYQCNIGYGSEANKKGYGWFNGTEKDPTTKKAYVTNTSPSSNGSDCSLTGWCNNVTINIHLRLGEKNKQITWYKMIFYDDADKELCAIGSNYGAALPSPGKDVYFDFNFLNGHISYIKVAFDYIDSSGNESECPKKGYEKIVIHKRLGNSSGVSNIYIGEETTAAPDIAPIDPQKEGWYLCKKTKEGIKSEKSDSLSPFDADAGKICIYVSAFSDFGKSTCNIKKYKSEQECLKALPNTDITTTTTTTTTTTAMTSYGELGTAGSGDINKASKAKLNASDVTYNSKNGHMDCEDLSVKDLIDEYWSIVMVLVPIVLMLLMSIDFIKALAANDQEQLKKSGNSAIKRTIAAVILLMLPALLSMILGWVGLELCI